MSALVKTEKQTTKIDNPASVEAMLAQETMIDLLFEITVLSSLPEALPDEVPNL